MSAPGLIEKLSSPAGVITLIAIVAIASDLVRGKIYNWLTLPALSLGLVVSFIRGGWDGGLDSFMGAGAGLFLYGWMFLIGMMGGGDVKLLMVFGAWGGAGFCAGNLAFSRVFGWRDGTRGDDRYGSNCWFFAPHVSFSALRLCA